MIKSYVKVKICGVRTESDIIAAIKGGADYVGMVFFPPSPRNLTFEQAGMLSGSTSGIETVALTVNADDWNIEQIIKSVAPDWLQLHGNESPNRAAEIREKFDVLVMKAVGVKDKKDLKFADQYSDAVDQLLIDAKPFLDSPLPGGNGVTFDWQLIEEWDSQLPWMLAGGLNAENVCSALKLTNALQVDVSSGVETRPGVKSTKSIAAFIQAVRGRKYEQT